MSPRNTADAHARVEARDRGLRRVRTATGWITVASTAGAVVLAGGYAQALPGKSASAAPPAVAPRGVATAKPSAAPSAHTASTAPAASSAPALQAPAQAPTTAASTAHVTSGGS
jgi:hypothetical protein